MKDFSREDYDHGEEAVVPVIVEKARMYAKDAGNLSLIGLVWTILGPMMGIGFLLEMAMAELQKKKEQLDNRLSWRMRMAEQKRNSEASETQPLECAEAAHEEDLEVPRPGINGDSEGDQVPEETEESQPSTEDSPPTAEQDATK